MASNHIESEEFYFQNDPFFHPKLEIDDVHRMSKVLELTGEFLFPKPKIELLLRNFRSQIAKGLHPSDVKRDPGDFPMYNTYVYKFPTGQEKGEFLGLDIGGTNLRILKLILNPTADSIEEREKIILEKYDVPMEYRRGKAKVFFDFLASKVDEFLQKHDEANSKPQGSVPMGFVFSFGFDQLAINRGICLQFGIATNLIDAIGRCPVEMFQSSLNDLKIPVKIVALANDSTATLIRGKFIHKETCASLILGSGSNVAYVEQVKNDKRITDVEKVFGEKVSEFIINSECVLYGDYNQMDFAKSRYDFELDAMSLIPKSYTFEKMVGGCFLGELFRLSLADLVRNRVILRGKFTPQILKPNQIPTSDMSLIDEELTKSSISYEQIDKLLTARLGYCNDDIEKSDRQIISYVCQLITIRCAILCAISLAAFADRLDVDKRFEVVKIACDGSLYAKHPKMDRLINGFLQVLSPDKNMKVFNVDDGSCVGAALIAACYSQF